MKKVYISGLIFVSLLGSAGFISAQTIPNPLAANNFGQLLTQIAGAVGALIASLGVIMIIVAGILYLTSAGSPERTGTAKKALIYAIAGITIGLAATVIVQIIKGIIGA